MSYFDHQQRGQGTEKCPLEKNTETETKISGEQEVNQGWQMTTGGIV